MGELRSPNSSSQSPRPAALPIKRGLRPSRSPLSTSVSSLETGLARERFPGSRVTHLEQARHWRRWGSCVSRLVATAPDTRSGLLCRPATLPTVRDCIASVNLLAVRLSSDLPTSDPFWMNQLPVDLWVGTAHPYVSIRHSSCQDRESIHNLFTNARESITRADFPIC